MLARKFIFSFILIAVCELSYAQTMQDIFDRKAKVTWVGLDFSQAKFIGDRERLGSTSDVQKLIEAWNDLMIKEKSKFDVAGAIDKPKVEEALEVTKEHNANLDVTEMFSNDVKDYFRFKPDDIIAIVNDYDFKGLSGLGVMFNVESFSKLNEEGSIWVTFINLGTKEVFFSERMTGKPSGFGMRNYWAGAIYNIIKAMEKKEFEMWRKKYYRKY